MDYSSNEIILYILILEGPSLDKPTMPLIRYYILASFQVVLLMLQAGKGKADSTCSITNLIFLGNYAKHFLWLETEEMSQWQVIVSSSLWGLHWLQWSNLFIGRCTCSTCVMSNFWVHYKARGQIPWGQKLIWDGNHHILNERMDRWL